MTKILQDVRVVELASWVFVPAAAAVLADWGADVIKIEHPLTGDPVRGLSASSIPTNSPNAAWEQSNRGKRDLALDVTAPRGREVLRRLLEGADVFLTSWLAKQRRRFSIDVADVRAWNPDIIYARGSGYGPRGGEADRAGFDATAYWYRAGFADSLSPDELEWPVGQRIGIGDFPSGAMLAGGVAGALFHRERTGEATVVDASLLSQAAWTMAPDIINGKINPDQRRLMVGRGDARNPIANLYRTQDSRLISLVMMDSDRYWDDFATRVGLGHLVDDPRFNHSSVRQENAVELIALLDELFASKSLAEWRPVLFGMKGAWCVVQTAAEVAVDPQVEANGYLQKVEGAERDLWLTAAPVQYDQEPPTLHRTPAHGEHSEDILQEIGYGWDEIIELKLEGVVG
jgi:crotonobetainyl-CoA:carnitine CoA-transferase CaiB-like acyl-CoA transferase